MNSTTQSLKSSHEKRHEEKELFGHLVSNQRNFLLSVQPKETGTKKQNGYKLGTKWVQNLSFFLTYLRECFHPNTLSSAFVNNIFGGQKERRPKIKQKEGMITSILPFLFYE